MNELNIEEQLAKLEIDILSVVEKFEKTYNCTIELSMFNSPYKLSNHPRLTCVVGKKIVKR